MEAWSREIIQIWQNSKQLLSLGGKPIQVFVVLGFPQLFCIYVKVFIIKSYGAGGEAQLKEKISA